MALPIVNGISFGVFPNSTTTSPPSFNDSGWFDITDHNRQPIDISYDNVEKDIRMANGFMRKFIVAQKRVIATSWENVPSITSASTLIKYSASIDGAGNSVAGLANVVSNITVDGKYGGAWLKSFYEGNVFIPIWIKLTYSNVPTSSGNYISGFTPSVSYTSQMNSASYFSYPTVANPIGTPSGSAKPEIFYGFMTKFSYNISKRLAYTDYVNMGIEFTEA